MNEKPEIGTFGDDRNEPGLPRRPGLRRGPPAGWRMATVASSLLLLSAVAGMASLLAGAVLLLPLAILAAPLILRRRMRRTGGGPIGGGKFPWRRMTGFRGPRPA
ncbi:MAG: hypothetical protein JWP91_1982 [Fibrobacteres bacterium]|nr:hypothetical protein [Fibrobacterota bacterium]